MKRAYSRTVTKAYQVYILLAPHFDEEFVISCLAQLRTAGLNVGLTGLRAASIQGYYGLTLQPDLSIGDLMTLNNSHTYSLVLPGTADCLTALLADPRVVELVSNSFDLHSDVSLLTIPLALTLLSQVGVTIQPEQLLVAAEWSELESAIGRMITNASAIKHQL